MNPDKKLLYTGIAGTVITAICCFTPVLVIAFSALGLAWAVGYIDYVLLPLLALFLGLTIYAGWRLARAGHSPARRSD